MISGSVTNNHGEFTIKGLASGKYLVKSNFIGYKTGKKPVEIVNTSVVFDKPIELASASITLGDVQITENGLISLGQ